MEARTGSEPSARVYLQAPRTVKAVPVGPAHQATLSRGVTRAAAAHSQSHAVIPSREPKPLFVPNKLPAAALDAYLAKARALFQPPFRLCEERALFLLHKCAYDVAAATALFDQQLAGAELVNPFYKYSGIQVFKEESSSSSSSESDEAEARAVVAAPAPAAAAGTAATVLPAATAASAAAAATLALHVLVVS